VVLQLTLVFAGLTGPPERQNNNAVVPQRYGQRAPGPVSDVAPRRTEARDRVLPKPHSTNLTLSAGARRYEPQASVASHFRCSPLAAVTIDRLGTTAFAGTADQMRS
jgi:hypothetical protein